MTRTAARSVTAVKTDGVVISDRPTVEVKIGSRVYTARAPKFQVWYDVLNQIQGSEDAYAAAQRLSEEGADLSLAEQRELAEIVRLGETFDTAANALIYGVEDQLGRIKGGFLRRSLRPEDWQAVLAECDDDESDLDLPELFEVTFFLRETFDPWFQERSASVGMQTPDVPARPVRKTAAKKKN